MGAPSLPPLYCLPGCGHLFFTSGMDHGASLSESERRPLGEISSLRTATNHLSPHRLLEQMEQLRPLNRLAALEMQARRSLTAANLFEQFECNSNPLRPQIPLGLVASPDSEPATSVSSQMRSSIGHSMFKKIRGEKRPIPNEHKDDKYYERRKRNNQAAKKSRDARKIREDQIALRAAILEHENGILRAQLVALREEVRALRRLLWGNPSLITEQCSNNS